MYRSGCRVGAANGREGEKQVSEGVQQVGERVQQGVEELDKGARQRGGWAETGRVYTWWMSRCTRERLTGLGWGVGEAEGAAERTGGGWSDAADGGPGAAGSRQEAAGRCREGAGSCAAGGGLRGVQRAWTVLRCCIRRRRSGDPPSHTIGSGAGARQCGTWPGGEWQWG